MSNLSTQIVSIINGQAVTTSLAIAEGTEVQHKNILDLIRSYRVDLEQFGRVTFEIQPFATAGGTQKREIATLNERQASLVLMYMRNSEIARGFKIRIIKEFWAMAERLAAPVFQIPKTLSEALLLAGKLAAKNEELEAQAAANQLKIEVYEEMVADNVSTFTVRETAKVLGYKESQLRRWLEREGMIFMNAKRQWEPMAACIERDTIRLKMEIISGRAISSPAITTKGLVLFRHMLGADDLLKTTTGYAAAVRAH